MNKKSKYSQFDSFSGSEVKKENGVDTNEKKIKTQRRFNMNTKKITTICAAIIIIAIIVCGIIIVHNTNETQKELNKPVIYNNTIEGVGTFQSTNCTNFTNIEDDGNGQIYYKSNLTGAEVSVGDKDKRYFDMSLVQAEKVNNSPKGHTIYKTQANVGEHAGEVRYTAVIEDTNNNRIIMISSPDKNLTDLMVDTFKVLQPVKKQEAKNTDKVTEQQQKDSQAVQDIKNNPNMPDDVKQRYEARQRAAEDGVSMQEYSKSPELVQKYQN